MGRKKERGVVDLLAPAGGRPHLDGQGRKDRPRSFSQRQRARNAGSEVTTVWFLPLPACVRLRGRNPRSKGPRGVFQALRRLRCPLTRCAAQAVKLTAPPNTPRAPRYPPPKSRS